MTAHIVICPHCKKKQKYKPIKSQKGKADFVDKRKKCLFCKKSFNIYKNFKNNNLVKAKAGPEEPADNRWDKEKVKFKTY